MDEKRRVTAWLEQEANRFYALSDAIWRYPELGMEEYHASKCLKAFLETEGFDVAPGAGGMPTAFVGSWGKGKPAIGINCEYDALPGLSQHPEPRQNPVVPGAPGHGCGHNILGVGSIMAAAAVKSWRLKSAAPGKIVVLGCPAEEICVGKPFMARAGLFDDLDAVLDWHPSVYNGAPYDTCNAYFNIKYHFSGRTAHGNAPWMGRSALDAAVLMGHAIELLREHIPPGHPDAANTLNYTFSEVGPEYPNVVPDRSTLWMIGRITTAAEMARIIPRIDRCAEAAALATETAWDREFITATHERIPNETLSRVVHENLLNLRPPRFTAEEQAFAKEMQQDQGARIMGLHEDVREFQGGTAGVSDNAEFSWFAPLTMLRMVTAPEGIGWHNWQIAATSGMTIGRKGMVRAAQVLAASWVDLIRRPDLLTAAQAERKERLAGRAYESLIPAGIGPPLALNRKTMEKYRPRLKAFKQST